MCASSRHTVSRCPVAYVPPSWLIGHRGARAVRLENSLGAFRWAVEHGVSTVEMDLRLTADGHLVCSHDSTLLRLFALNARVRDLTAADLATIDPNAPAALPLAPDVLDVAEGRARVVLEMKPDVDSRELPEVLFALLTERRAAGKVDDILCISSFDHDAVLHFRRLAPALAKQLAFLVTYDASATVAVRKATVHGIQWVHPHYSGILREPWVGAVAASRGVALATYTVNHPSVARLMCRLGVSYVFTDDPYLLDPRRATA